MEKETLIQNLKDRVGENDFSVLSQRTIDSIIDPIMPMFADDSTVTDDTYTLPVNMLRSYIGQYRHDLADGMKNGKTAWENEQKTNLAKAVEQAVSDAKKQWEQDNVTKATAEPQEKKQTAISADDVVQKVLENLNGEKGALSEMKSLLQGFIKKTEKERRERTVDSIRSEIKSHLMELDNLDDDDFILEYTMDHVKVDENTDLAKAKEEAVKIYEAAYQRNAKRFGGFVSANGGGSAIKDSVDDFKDFIRERQEKVQQEQRDADALNKMLVYDTPRVRLQYRELINIIFLIKTELKWLL